MCVCVCVFVCVCVCVCVSVSLCVHAYVCVSLYRTSPIVLVHGSGMSHATTASPKPSYRAPWRVGDTVEMVGGQHQRVDISAHARTAHKGLLQKRLEKDLFEIVLHATSPPPPYDRIGKGTELN